MNAQYLGGIVIDHNHGQIVLCNATWRPYPLGREHYNVDGNNGYIEGTVVSGGHTSRLFHCSSFKPLPVGTIHRQDYCPITRIHSGRISCVTCG
jgi:hypothetical protein